MNNKMVLINMLCILKNNTIYDFKNSQRMPVTTIITTLRMPVTTIFIFIFK